MLAPFAGTVVAVWHARQDSVCAGQPLVVLEAMKMEHEVVAEVYGVVRSVEVAVGDTVEPGQRLAVLAPASINGPEAPASIDGPEAPASTDESEAPASIDESEAPASIDPPEAPAR